ncbi:hypothetical protein FE783_26185 [Paenibacillus mesophilus]|uniref:hypothetical protein n=1 Tax=Paenibacillus mesophilus TaxID=2582849 RepID=UPI00110ECBF8|nr:hypothetical protein [Paenibacillus mesophilus]TMV46454.1 hypothetical protein FE783_26185 [Paenibacillus mesophilus]
MNHKRLFHKIALSTLLLSAFASPSAFADTTLETDKVLPAIQMSAARMLDPVKLAETYAPETVSDWQQTLSQYHEALRSKVKMNAGGISATIKALPIGEVELGTSEAGEEPAAVLSEALSLDKSVTISKVFATDAVKLTKAEIAAERVELIGGAAVGVAADDKNAAIAISVSAIAADLPMSPFMQGWSELDKAVQTNDGNTIRQALANQLALYKQEIVHLNEIQPVGVQLMDIVPATPAAAAEPSNG